MDKLIAKIKNYDALRVDDEGDSRLLAGPASGKPVKEPKLTRNDTKSL